MPVSRPPEKAKSSRRPRARRLWALLSYAGDPAALTIRRSAGHVTRVATVFGTTFHEENRRRLVKPSRPGAANGPLGERYGRDGGTPELPGTLADRAIKQPPEARILGVDSPEPGSIRSHGSRPV